eukprot:gene58027-biopygen2931
MVAPQHTCSQVSWLTTIEAWTKMSPCCALACVLTARMWACGTIGAKHVMEAKTAVPPATAVPTCDVLQGNMVGAQHICPFSRVGCLVVVQGDQWNNVDTCDDFCSMQPGAWSCSGSSEWGNDHCGRGGVGQGGDFRRDLTCSTVVRDADVNHLWHVACSCYPPMFPDYVVSYSPQGCPSRWRWTKNILASNDDHDGSCPMTQLDWPAMSSGVTVGVAVDLDEGKMHFARNGEWTYDVFTGVQTGGTPPSLVFSVAGVFRFNPGDFEPPDGFSVMPIALQASDLQPGQCSSFVHGPALSRLLARPSSTRRPFKHADMSHCLRRRNDGTFRSKSAGCLYSLTDMPVHVRDAADAMRGSAQDDFATLALTSGMTEPLSRGGRVRIES